MMFLELANKSYGGGTSGGLKKSPLRPQSPPIEHVCAPTSSKSLSDAL